MLSSHSASSSPDILAPPGDVDYLISSPFKPFQGRQSSAMSPANFRILNTPGAGRRKRSRISLSPAKSAHSIRFDDILLPGSPTRKGNGRQRSISPDKAEAEGNVSPWRIRVTLEATQDDQENQGSPSRKRPRPSTTTTKIPLKDGSEQTPRRGRGRPRKSDTPKAALRSGSPGHTPGPIGDSGQRRRPGRPRKSQPEPAPIESIEQVETEMEAQQAESAPSGTEPERRSWSPLNLAGDADSDDGFGDGIDIPFNVPDQIEQPAAEQNLAPTFEKIYGTPNGEAIDRFYSRPGDDELHSTPSKMPSPTRDLQVASASPVNSLHAGHTPRPPRVYPTPTSSSLVGDERQVGNKPTQNTSATADKLSAIPPSDPTNEYRDFDTIMESEGFSMVSLDTLPSARQHGLQSNSKIVKGSLKPFIQRESNGVLKQKARVLDPRPEVFPVPSPSPEPLPSPEPQINYPQLPVQYPQLPAASSSTSAKRLSRSPAIVTKPSPVPSRKRLLGLAKLVRLGIVLRNVLSHSNPAPAPGEQIADFMEPRRRLEEEVFSDLNPDSQRLLRVALGLGQVLAIRRKYSELRSPVRKALVEAENLEDYEEDLDNPQFEHTMNVSGTPNRQFDGTAESSPGTEMKRRFAEWQKEREAISRAIEEANSSQVIVINSDASGLQDSEREDELDELDMHESPQQLRQREKEEGEEEEQQQQHYEDGYEQEYEEKRQQQASEEEDEGPDYDVGADDDDDDGSEDIWQVQAKEEGNSGRGSVLDPHNDQQSSPQKDDSSPADQGFKWTFSPGIWLDGQGKVPSLGQSRVRKLREQDANFSDLPGAEYTPNQARYFGEKSSPLSSAQGRSPQRNLSSAASQRHTDAERHKDELREESEELDDYLNLSPERDLEDETYQIDPTTRHETEMERHQSNFADNASLSDVVGEESSVHEETLTPQNPKPANKDDQGSSWFQRITNFTPAWLKAPGRDSSPARNHSSPLPSRSSSHASTLHDEQSDEDDGRPLEPIQEDEVRESEAPPSVIESESESEPLPTPPRPQAKVTETSVSTSPNLEEEEAEEDDTEAETEKAHSLEEQEQTPTPLSTSGYFTNAHYTLLRRLLRIAEKSPEVFPYHPKPAHADIIGDYIWTSDNSYGVPITKLQFAIIQRFRQELAVGNRRAGGTGYVGWTEADLHRRLVSIIIGQQIREDRRNETRATRAMPKSIIQRG
ncbi:hypothetical protein BJX63DRAFT_48522 [Aspergillus granulosus]|uniref:AT DNA binding protein n=1 Tax=Aspergillus granulosus TaxID=176169 RepID=A0ABR4HTX7_9EURO